MRCVRFLLLGVLMAAAVPLTIGCEGGSRDPVATCPALGVVQVSVTTTAHAGMVFPATGSYELQLSNTGDGTFARTRTVTAAGNVLTASLTLGDVAPGQFLINVFAAGDATGSPTASLSAFLFRTTFVQTFGQGELVSVPVAIGATDTARSFAYSFWPSAAAKTIDLFAPDAASLSALVATMTAHLKKSSGKVSNTFKWNPGIATMASELGKATP
ncbi:MAG: hypothetical protein GX442_20050 [Candidatus Riflebacteria bacterium]|nr:hypothetical protein [Candidatus Riflebacteria bacterium]